MIPLHQENRGYEEARRVLYVPEKMNQRLHKAQETLIKCELGGNCIKFSEHECEEYCLLMLLEITCEASL